MLYIQQQQKKLTIASECKKKKSQWKQNWRQNVITLDNSEYYKWSQLQQEVNNNE